MKTSGNDVIEHASSRARSSSWWWTVLAVPPVVAVITTVLAPDPHGHWTEHLASAALKTTQLILLLVLVVMLGRRRLSSLLMIAFVVIGVGIVLQTVGDFQVANSIWRTSGDPGFGGDGYVEGHDRSALGDLIVLVAGLAFIVIAAVGRRVSIWLAVAAAVLMVIPPPFFWPAVGVMLLMLYWLTVDRQPREPVAAQT